MRAIWLILLILTGCTLVRINIVDYCHNADGTLRDNDPRCTNGSKPNTELPLDHNQNR